MQAARRREMATGESTAAEEWVAMWPDVQQFLEELSVVVLYESARTRGTEAEMRVDIKTIKRLRAQDQELQELESKSPHNKASVGVGGRALTMLRAFALMLVQSQSTSLYARVLEKMRNVFGDPAATVARHTVSLVFLHEFIFFALFVDIAANPDTLLFQPCDNRNGFVSVKSLHDAQNSIISERTEVGLRTVKEAVDDYQDEVEEWVVKHNEDWSGGRQAANRKCLDAVASSAIVSAVCKTGFLPHLVANELASFYVASIVKNLAFYAPLKSPLFVAKGLHLLAALMREHPDALLLQELCLKAFYVFSFHDESLQRSQCIVRRRVPELAVTAMRKALSFKHLTYQCLHFLTRCLDLRLSSKHFGDRDHSLITLVLNALREYQSDAKIREAALELLVLLTRPSKSSRNRTQALQAFTSSTDGEGVSLVLQCIRIGATQQPEVVLSGWILLRMCARYAKDDFVRELASTKNKGMDLICSSAVESLKLAFEPGSRTVERINYDIVSAIIRILQYVSLSEVFRDLIRSRLEVFCMLQCSLATVTDRLGQASLIESDVRKTMDLAAFCCIAVGNLCHECEQLRAQATKLGLLDASLTLLATLLENLPDARRVRDEFEKAGLIGKHEDSWQQRQGESPAQGSMFAESAESVGYALRAVRQMISSGRPGSLVEPALTLALPSGKSDEDGEEYGTIRPEALSYVLVSLRTFKRNIRVWQHGVGILLKICLAPSSDAKQWLAENSDFIEETLSFLAVEGSSREFQIPVTFLESPGSRVSSAQTDAEEVEQQHQEQERRMKSLERDIESLRSWLKKQTGSSDCRSSSAALQSHTARSLTMHDESVHAFTSAMTPSPAFSLRPSTEFESSLVLNPSSHAGDGQKNSTAALKSSTPFSGSGQDRINNVRSLGDVLESSESARQAKLTPRAFARSQTQVPKQHKKGFRRFRSSADTQGTDSGNSLSNSPASGLWKRRPLLKKPASSVQ
ncbi:hypothetical protein FVE85_6336 [Porphyridium purpureum]|uniref:Uncharacterized protein n=1 Tax=Porphyridium purpureum TaxID=35688 RepID=A0A5J4Z4G7_PORPP|nr:hypothetical protein FVE85_6336 [Porphyridium purpureum]|eukprot:POR7820..scf295_1